MVSHELLKAFLVEAKRRTYAAQADDTDVESFVPGSRQLEYRQGELLYRDIYFGSAFFVGQETVYAGDSPVWSMGYAGGVIPADLPAEETCSVYRFLAKALRSVETERPFRGPHTLVDEMWVYNDGSEGDIRRFHGVETITRDGKLIYTLRYSGGLLR